MRLIFAIFSIFVLLFVGAIIGPSFVDWNKYKPQIIEQVKNASGFDVQVNGDLSLAILPSPRVKIEDMVVAAPSKRNFENILSMKSAEVSVALMPLLKKQVKVKSVTLISPDIQVEILPDGTPSWVTEKLTKAKQVKDVAPSKMKQDVANAGGKVMDSIALDKLEIKDGKLNFVNHQTGATYAAKDVDVELEADSLKGPFKIEGSLVYQGKKIILDVETGKLPKGDEGLSVQAEVSLPDASTSLDFKGVAAISAPYEVQGQTNLKIGSAAKLKAATGVSMGGYNKSLGMEGLLTANEDDVAFDNLKLSLGGFVGNGKLSVKNLKSKNPLMVAGNIKSSSILNLNDFMTSNKNTAASRIGFAKKAYAASGSKSLVPQVLTLPMLVDANMKFDLGGVKVQNHTIKGVFLDLNKSGKTTKATFKALELPGQGKVDGALTMTYASSSQSSKTGQVTYSDPSVSYTVNGQANQLAAFLKAFAPDADTSAVTKLYKTAQFNLKGAVSGHSISLKDSVLKLDNMVVGLGGRYQSAAAGGRAKAMIDVSADTVDFDRIMQAQGKAPTTNKSSATSSKSTKEALKPIQGFSLPLDLGFDVSLQKARINGADLNGLRLTGDLTGKKLNLKTASVNNFAGAAISLKGQVGNLSDLTGLDLSLYTKTSNLNTLASALKVDTSKLPKNLKALEVNLSGKGSVNSLNFNANVKALGGQLDAAGVAKDLLGTPSYSGLSLGMKHSNLVKAIQIVSPSFKGQAGLNQAVNFHTNANINGKQYDLSNMKVTLGATKFGGNLKINAGANPVSVRGNIAAGKIALDSLLGAKKSSGGSSKSSGGSSASKSSGRWSKAPIDLSWMKTLDVNVGLSASSLTYGAWNFIKPSTDLKIANGQMNINAMKAGVFGGQATVTTQVNASPVSLSLNSSMNNIDIEKLARALSGGSKLKASGSVSFDMDVKSSGASAHALINALNGKADLDGTNVTLKGFDLVKLARGLATEEKLITSATSFVSGAMSGGQTKFDTIKGDYKIQNGKVIITSMAMDNPDAVINSTGYADLPSWFINVDNKITLKNVKDLEPFGVKIKGPLDNPSDTFGKHILENYISSKVKRKLNKELGDKLPDILGSDVTDKLKKFGVLPQDEAPKAKEVPAPTNDNTAPVETAPVQPVAPKPAPVKKKIEKPEDALKTILDNQGSPEDAVNDLIKGLF